MEQREREREWREEVRYDKMQGEGSVEYITVGRGRVLCAAAGQQGCI
jgi:hypothetical protein